MSVLLVEAVNSADPVAIVSALKVEKFAVLASSRDALTLANSLGRCVSMRMEFGDKSDALLAEIEELAHQHCVRLAREDNQWRTVFDMILVGHSTISLQLLM